MFLSCRNCELLAPLVVCSLLDGLFVSGRSPLLGLFSLNHPSLFCGFLGFFFVFLLFFSVICRVFKVVMPLSLLSRSQVAGGVEWVATEPSCFSFFTGFLLFCKILFFVRVSSSPHILSLLRLGSFFVCLPFWLAFLVMSQPSRRS